MAVKGLSQPQGMRQAIYMFHLWKAMIPLQAIVQLHFKFSVLSLILYTLYSALPQWRH